MGIGRAEACKLGREDVGHGLVGLYDMRYWRSGKDAGGCHTQQIATGDGMGSQGSSERQQQEGARARRGRACRLRAPAQQYTSCRQVAAAGSCPAAWAPRPPPTRPPRLLARTTFGLRNWSRRRALSRGRRGGLLTEKERKVRGETAAVAPATPPLLRHSHDSRRTAYAPPPYSCTRVRALSVLPSPCAPTPGVTSLFSPPSPRRTSTVRPPSEGRPSSQ